MKSKTFFSKENIILFLLFAMAAFLRLWDLDMMTFRYDQAAAAFRAREVLSGSFPWTGITNSMGFRNAPGFIWLIIPPLLLTGSPVIATGWIGLVISTAVFPIHRIARRLTDSTFRWIPTIIFATAPYMVFYGRNLWAQCLLVAIGAWAFWFMIKALETPAAESKTHFRYSVIALTLLAFGTSVHFSAALHFLIAAVVLLWPIKNLKRILTILILPASVFATMLPSVFDYAALKLGPPKEQPQFAAHFAGLLPEPLPLWQRLPDTFTPLLFPDNFETVYGSINELTFPAKGFLKASNITLGVLFGAGFLVLIVYTLRSESHPSRTLIDKHLLLWFLLPLVIGCTLLSSVNPTYFSASWFAPPLFAAFLFNRIKSTKVNVLGILATGILGIILTASTALLFHHINKEKFIAGPYYIPYKYQRETIKILESESIRNRRFEHLSGTVFQHSYDYIAVHVAKLSQPKADDRKYALLQDINILSDQPTRKELFINSSPQFVNSVGVLITPTLTDAQDFMFRYYNLDLPAESNITQSEEVNP